MELQIPFSEPTADGPVIVRANQRALDRLSYMGAAFANGELINALDMDPVLPPGHVTPFVLPASWVD